MDGKGDLQVDLRIAQGIVEELISAEGLPTDVCLPTSSFPCCRASRTPMDTSRLRVHRRGECPHRDSDSRMYGSGHVLRPVQSGAAWGARRR